jgi:hypothetical protein
VVRTFTNADLAALSPTTSGAAGGQTIAAAGPLFATGAAAVQQTMTGSAPTIGPPHPNADLGGLGADASPLPVGQAVQAFEASMARLVPKVDEVDNAFGRYRQSCIGLSTVLDVGTRSWAGIWDGTHTPAETADECEPMLAAALRVGRQVQNAMRTAEDQARRSGVTPGVTRQIRAQYGLDWPGWDH